MLSGNVKSVGIFRGLGILCRLAKSHSVKNSLLILTAFSPFWGDFKTL